MRPSQPTSVRFLVIAVSVLMSIKLYLDRFSLSSMQPYITEEMRLSEFAVASFLGTGFFLSYALGQVPTGWLGDRFGPRAMLALYILVWSLFTGLTGLADGFVLLMIARLGCGLGQAGAYPACGNLLSKWVPLTTRGLASSMVAGGGRVGAFIAPLLTYYLMIAFVPASTPVEITADQLLNGPKIAARLTASEEQTPAARRLAGFLPESLRNDIELAGRKHLAWERATSDQKATGVAAPLDDAHQEQLLQALNRLLDERELHADKWLGNTDHPFASLSIEREARETMERLENGGMLTTEQARRLNRLILEAALPEIQKLYGNGWRPVLWLYGVTGVLVAAAFWFLFRDHPREHPWCNPAEIERIEAGKVPTPTRATAGIPWLPLLSSSTMWLSSILQFGTNIGWLLVVTYMPRYLLEVHQAPLSDRSMMVSIPPIGGLVGMFLGGFLTDFLTHTLGLRWGRALPMALTRFGAGAAYFVCIQSRDPWVATAAFTAMFFFVDLGVSATWAFVQDVGGRNVGSVLGWGNMWGNLGATVALPLYSLCLGQKPGSAEWNIAFTICAGAFFISGIAAMGIDATRPIIPEDRDTTRLDSDAEEDTVGEQT